MKTKLALLAALALAVSVIPQNGCNEPTYVTVKLTTDVPCERLQGVALTFGTLGAIEDKIATTRTADCNGGEIGTITVVPTDAEDGEFGIRAVMGIERDVDTCVPPYGDGCVVARRGLRFLPDRTLTLPIVLRQICNNIPCGPYDTCVKGQCVPAKIDPEKCTSAQGCDEDQLASGGGGGSDSGLDAVADGPLIDGGPGIDFSVPQLETFCGPNGPVDLGSPWPMHDGCVTRANRTRFVGPISKPNVEAFVPNGFQSLAMSGGPTAFGGVSNAVWRLDLPSRQATQLSTAITTDVTCAIRLLDVVCSTGTGFVDIDRMTNMAKSTRVQPDGGSTIFAPGWTVGPPNVVYAIGATDKQLYAFTPVTLLWKRPIPGTTVFSAPALSRDGQTIYVASDTALTAFAANDGSQRWTRTDIGAPVVAVGLADVIHTVTRVVAGGPFHLRSRLPNGDPAGADVQLQPETGAIQRWALGIGQSGSSGVLRERVLVLRNPRVDAVNTQDRTREFSVATPSNPVMVWSLDDRLYVAGDGSLTAISLLGGGTAWTATGPWTTASALAIGPDHALYVSSTNGVFRASVP